MHNWTGLLVEPLPGIFQYLKKSGRNAWKLNACLATQKSPHIVRDTFIVLTATFYKVCPATNIPRLHKDEFINTGNFWGSQPDAQYIGNGITVQQY